MFRAFLVLTGAGVVVALLSFAAHNSRGQSSAQGGQSTVKRTVLRTSSRSSISGNPSPVFMAAAARNLILKNELTWTFGGKQQRGWSLYSFLIKQALHTSNEDVTAEFAAALAGWQEKKGLNSDGVLDEKSLLAMVFEWQSQRLKDRTYAAPEDLITVPASDFYDPERPLELRQVERKTYAAYNQMVNAAVADRSLNLAHTSSGKLALTEKYFKIISAFRSREYQEQLRRKSPNSGRAGLAVNSPHFTGRALDIYVGGDPVDTDDGNRAIQVKTRAYQWLVRNAGRFGFRPYFYEPWHWEYVR